MSPNDSSFLSSSSPSSSFFLLYHHFSLLSSSFFLSSPCPSFFWFLFPYSLFSFFLLLSSFSLSFFFSFLFSSQVSVTLIWKYQTIIRVRDFLCLLMTRIRHLYQRQVYQSIKVSHSNSQLVWPFSEFVFLPFPIFSSAFFFLFFLASSPNFEIIFSNSKKSGKRENFNEFIN